MSLMEKIGTRLVFADGDTDALLIATGVRPESCIEAQCMENPGLVANCHTAFADAGSEIIRTNSFGANSVRLASFGLADHVNEINWQAAQIARQSVKGRDVTVAGSVGPLPTNDLPRHEVAAVFREQIGALLDGGAQMIFFEAFGDLDDLLVALEIKYSLHHCPAVCSLSFSNAGTLADGTTLAAAFAKLANADADILGISCSQKSCLALAAAAHELSLSTPCTISLSRMPADKPDPEEFASTCPALARVGVGIIAGGSGILAKHLAAARKNTTNPSGETLADGPSS